MRSLLSKRASDQFNQSSLSFQGISVDLSTLRAEWEQRSAAASGGNSLSSSFGQLSNNNESSSVSGSGNDANEEIDVVGGLDSCSESGSERMDSAADGSIDGECFPRLLDQKPSNFSTNHLQNPNSGLNLNLDLNHQQGINHWGLSLLERRRELVSLSNSAMRTTNNNRLISHQTDRVLHDDEVQSSSIDLSVKGREERKRLNPFSIDSLLGNNRCSTPSVKRDRSSTPALSNGRESTTPTSPTSPISLPTSPSTT